MTGIVVSHHKATRTALTMKFIQHSAMRRVFLFLIVLFNLFYRTESQNSQNQSALTTPSLEPRSQIPPLLTTAGFESANLSSTDIITHLQVSTDALSRPAITRVPLTPSTDALPTGPAITRVPTTSTDALIIFRTLSRSTPSSTSLPRNNNTKEFCESEKVGTPEAYGIFVWPDTPVGNRSTLPCPYNPESFASRECLYANRTESGNVWGPIDVTKCKYNDVRSKDLFLLAQKEVNISNVVETSQEVKNLSSVNPPQTLQPGDISNIATVLVKIVSVPQKANEISDDFFTTVDNVLDSRIENVLTSQQNANSSSRIVEALNNLLEALIIGPGNKFVKVNRNYAINLQVVQPQTFTGLSFSGIVRKSHESSLKNNSISTKDDDSVPTAANSAASISIPRTLFNESTITNRSIQQTAIFVLYKETKFFSVSFVDSSETSNRLNSFVIAGSIKGLSVANLSEPVKIGLQRIVPGDTNSTLCSYWDFSLGNWSQEGCRFERVLGDGRILCNCNHLTNFAMLMDINPEPTKHDRILGVISYVGCALSLAGLILTIITILILRDLRSKIPGQILLNFCIALSLSLIVFLAAAERSKTSSLAGCRTAAIALHYFLLATFLWMAIEAFNMYLAFVKVFPTSNPSKFMLKCCLFAWGLPVIIVAITMIAALDKYGDDTYCRLHGVPFIVAFFTPVTLIIVGNIVAFCLIIRSLITSGTKVTSVRKASGHLQARQGIAIMVLLGLTWIFGIFAINDAKLAFQYLFCIFNSLQGFFVFIMFCVLPDGTRRQLQTLIRKTIDALRREDKHQNLEAGNASLNNLAYSSNVSPVVATSELQFRSLSSDNQVTETSFQSGDGFRIENDDLQKEISDLKFPDAMFSNPNVTRYSVRKNGSNYITTIELNLKGDF